MEKRRFVCPIGCDTTNICIPCLIWLCFLYVSDASTLWLLWLLRDWCISRRVFMVVCKCWLTTSYVVVKLEKVLIGNGKVFAFMHVSKGVQNFLNWEMLICLLWVWLWDGCGSNSRPYWPDPTLPTWLSHVQNGRQVNVTWLEVTFLAKPQ